MNLNFFGGSGDFLINVEWAVATYSSIGPKKVVVEYGEYTATFRGTDLDLDAGGLLTSAGEITSISFEKSGVLEARFKNINWNAKDAQSALIALNTATENASDELGALLSTEVLNVNAFSATQGFSLGGYIVPDGGVVFSGSKFADIFGASGGTNTFLGRAGEDQFAGGRDVDVIMGGGGGDTAYGGAGNDKIFGNAGADILFGDAGDDKINGHGGIDNIEGGDGKDVINAGGGGDIVYGDAGDDEIDGGGGRDSIFGGDDNDVIRAGNGNDKVYGDAGNDLLGGGGGKDSIYGGDGNDFIIGGFLKDDLFGGSGADQFIYASSRDSGKGTAADEIHDFELGTDFIDLSLLSVTLITGKFTGTGGEFRVIDDGTDTSVLVDVNGDGATDMKIEVLGVVGLASDSFV